MWKIFLNQDVLFSLNEKVFYGIIKVPQMT